jgi:hypothetical protein
MDSQSSQTLVLTFFSLSVLYLIVFLTTTFRYELLDFLIYRLCSITKFSEDAKISKGFYIIVFLISMARTTLFGVGAYQQGTQ